MGAADCTSPFWSAQLDADVPVPSGEARAFSLTNYGAAANFNNYVIAVSYTHLLGITNDVDRGGTGYTEYGAIRFDNQPSGNAECWLLYTSS